MTVPSVCMGNMVRDIVIHRLCVNNYWKHLFLGTAQHSYMFKISILKSEKRIGYPFLQRFLPE